MEFDFVEQEPVGKRKRKRSKRQLAVQEKVEVRSEEEGFLGSWHPGTVIACCNQGSHVEYDVKYDHILVDDGSGHLVDCVHDSLLVDGIDCVNANRGHYRGLIRPLPPPFDFREWCLPYGMCVDVHYNDCWWEGVIFDHEDGLEERKIFFPDLGDEMMMPINMLRVTQDWNEVTESWQRRGTWFFLELIEKYEQEHYVPVSVKQLWYDLREKEDFKKLGEWTSSMKALWEKLVLEAIGDNLKIVVNHLFEVTGPPDVKQQLLEFVKPFNDVNTHPEAELSEACAIAPIESTLNGNTLLHPSSSNVQSSKKRSDIEKLVSLSPNDGSNINPSIESNVSCHDEEACVLPQALLASPSDPDGISFVSFVTNDEAFCSSNSNKINRKYSTSVCSKTSWLPAGTDIVPGADFCPDAAIKYARMGNKRPRNTIIINARKHLSFLKWKIEFMRDKGMTRLRYTSPNGKTYHSLRQVCLDLSADAEILSPPISPDEQRSLCLFGDSSSPLSEQSPESQDLYNCPRAVIPSDAEELPIEPENCPQAIVEWYNFGSEERNVRKIKKTDVNQMTLRARKHLAHLGWLFWYKSYRGRRVLHHSSPHGKCYFSLRLACKDVIDESTSGVSASTSSSTSTCISHLRKPPRSHKINVQVRRKRKHSLPVAFHSLQTETNLDAQNISLPMLKSEMVSRCLIKFQNDKKRTQPIHVLRSSKRVQQVVAPNPSHQNPKTVLSWLIDNNVVLPRAKVNYCSRKGRHPTAEGRITRDGIKCNCCRKVYSFCGFEDHAGSKSYRPVGSKCCRPASSIFLEDGRSLLDCQIQLIQVEKIRNCTAEPPDGLKRSWHKGENDYICSVCHYGGELILCDQCPSSFHKNCLGMKEIPDGDWFCPSCCCKICGQNKLKKGAEHIMDDGVVNCTQCERKYHIVCLRSRGAAKLESHPKENWFCSKNCEVVFLGLHQLLGKPISVGVDNLTWTLFKSMQFDHHKPDIEALAETHSKLKIALDVMHECFEPVQEPCSGRDLAEDVIFSKGSELNRVNFQGFYTVLLEKDEELITAATVRVYGDMVAEIPLIGTRFQYRRLGMCSILMNLLEKKLIELGVQRLILPAVPSVLNTWTGSFGFSKMTDSERLQFLDYTFLDFQDTVMCQKLLLKIPSAESSPSKELQPTVHDDVCESGDDIDPDGSSSISEVLQTYQTEEGGIVEGPVDVAAGNCSSDSKDPINLVNQPANLEHDHCTSKINKEFLVEDATFMTEKRVDDNGSTTFNKESRFGSGVGLKCYKRRSLLACGS